MKVLVLFKRKTDTAKARFRKSREKLSRTVFAGAVCIFGVLFGEEVQASPFQGMRPILRTSSRKNKVNPSAKKGTDRHREVKADKTKKKAQKKSVNTKAPQPAKVSAADLQLLRRLEAQILQVRMDRRRWEEHKRGLLAEFANHQSAFAATLPNPEHSQPSSSLLLALFSKSMDDFVHNRVMMNYLNAYRMQKNQAYVNLVHNIQQADYALQNYAKLEQQLLQQWQLEKTKIEMAQLPTKTIQTAKR